MPVLRVFEINGSRIVYDQLAVFQGHYIARQIRIVSDGKLEADLKLDVIEALKPDLVLSAPATATPVDLTKVDRRRQSTGLPCSENGGLQCSPKTTEFRAHRDHPRGTQGRWPPRKPAANRRVEMLWNASTDAVEAEWVYRPFVVMGQPRPVEMEIYVNFSIN